MGQYSMIPLPGGWCFDVLYTVPVPVCALASSSLFFCPVESASELDGFGIDVFGGLDERRQTVLREHTDGKPMWGFIQTASAIGWPAFLTGFRREESETPSELRRVLRRFPGAGRAGSSASGGVPGGWIRHCSRQLVRNAGQAPAGCFCLP